MKSCEFCRKKDQKNFVDHNGTEVFLDLDENKISFIYTETYSNSGQPWDDEEYSIFIDVPAKYCPNCGRKL